MKYSPIGATRRPGKKTSDVVAFIVSVALRVYPLICHEYLIVVQYPNLSKYRSLPVYPERSMAEHGKTQLRFFDRLLQNANFPNFFYMKELSYPISFFYDLLWANLGERPGRPMAVRWKINLILTNTPCMPALKLIFRLELEKIIYSVRTCRLHIFSLKD